LQSVSVYMCVRVCFRFVTFNASHNNRIS